MTRSAALGAVLVLLAAALLAGGAGAAPPAITVPADQTIEATSATGADFTYTASAVNGGGQPVPVVCSPPSGTTFSFGITSS